MAIAYKSQGAGVSTEMSGAALSPLCPATVDPNDILIAHVFWEGVVTGPATPSGWTLLRGPDVIATTIARHWVFGKIAAGTEDATAVAFGAPSVTTQRAARIYSFSGYESGTIPQLVRGFVATSHATDPQMPSVTTTLAGALAVALVAQNDNNAFAAPTGATGGAWVEAVAEYTAALTPGLSLGIEICTPTGNPGTVSGGSMATTNDPCGVIGFQIRQNASTSISVGVSVTTDTSLALSKTKQRATGLSTETEAAFALDRQKRLVAGLAAETDAVQVMTIHRWIIAGLSAETGTALELAWAVSTEVPVGTALEDDAATAATFFKQLATGQASEDAVALAGGFQKLLSVSRADESDAGISIVESQVEADVAIIKSNFANLATAQNSFRGSHGKYCQVMPIHATHPNTWTAPPADNWNATGANGFGIVDVYPQLQTNIVASGGVSANFWIDEYVAPSGPGYQVSIQYRDATGRRWIESVGYGPEAAARTGAAEVALV